MDSPRWFDGRFRKAWDDHTRYRVLGIALHPFCLADFIALDQAESPLLWGGPMDFADLAVAVMICSSTRRPWRLWLSDSPPENGFVAPTGLRAHFLICRMRFARYWPVRWGGGLLKETERLHAYLRDCWNAEAYTNLIKRKQTGQPLGTPWPMARVTLMCHYMHISRREAFTMPLSQVEWHIAAIEEQMTDACVMAGAVKDEDEFLKSELDRWKDLSIEEALALGRKEALALGRK